MERARVKWAGRRLLALTAFVASMLSVPSGASGESRYAASPLRIDLASGAVNGHLIVGRNFASVVTAFGEPTWRTFSRRTLRAGYGDRLDFRMMVRYEKVGGLWRAKAVTFERGPLVETLMGQDVLAMSLGSFTSAAAKAYPGKVVTVRKRTCVHQACAVVFAIKGSGRRITFGHDGLGAYLTLWSASR